MNFAITPAETSVAGKHAFCVHGQKFVVSERYTPVETVGVGSYGIVVSAVDKYTGEKVAIKRIAGAFEDVVDGKRILREIRAMRLLSHANLLPLWDMEDPESPDFDDVYMISPLFDKDLDKVLRSDTELTEDHIKYFTYQLLCALRFIHRASIMHRDVKPENCLVQQSCDMVLCDFGLARYAGGRELAEKPHMTEYVVTRWYRAPELIFTGQYTDAVDIWALGCVIAQMYQRRPLFPGRDFKHQVELICSVIGKPTESEMTHITSHSAQCFLRNLPQTSRLDFTTLFPDASHDAIDLLQRMLEFAPERRISAEQALTHPFCKDYYDPEDMTATATHFDTSMLEPRARDGTELTTEDIKMAMLHEIRFFRPNAPVFRTPWKA